MPVRFQVDGDFYDHPKTTGMSDAAFALWVRAGSFSAAKLTDGFISEDVLAHTLRREASIAEELVRRRLWRRVKGGWKFHDWNERNLTKQRVLADQKADRDRKKARRDAAAEAARNEAGQATDPNINNIEPQVEHQNVRPDSNRNPDGIRSESEKIPAGSVSVSVSESVSVSGSGRGAGRAHPPRPEPPPEPPTRCPKHTNDHDPPACGQCGNARTAHERWQRAHADWERRVAEWDRTAPKCPRHQAQAAHNCGLCRSERLAE